MPKRRELIAGFLLGCAGFAGNWFKYPLFLNIDFLFGSFFVMVALLRYGTNAGITASLVASSCTFLLWKHPYAVIIFTMEAVVVGILNSKRKKSDILFHDILYWLILGAPLVWIFYHQLLQDTNASAWLIMLKQAMNGIFNALLASIVYLILMSREKVSGNLPSYRQVVFTIMVSLVLFPSFLYIFYNLRSISSQRNELLARQTVRAADTAVAMISSELSENLQSVVSLAQLVGDPARKSTGEIQHIVEITKETSPAFWRMGVMDKNATTVAYSPRVDELGRSTLGISLADRVYFKELQMNRKPQIAGVLKGKIGNNNTVIPLIAPILVDGTFKGYCSGVIRTKLIEQPLDIITKNLPMHITVLDQFGHVVVSTRRDLSTMMPYVRHDSASLQQIAPNVVQWVPPIESGRNMMQRWAKSLFISEKEISPESHWKVIVENSYGPLLSDLRDHASNSLAGLVLLCILLVPVSRLLSFRLTRSIDRLRSSTQLLPDNIKYNLPEALPKSSIREVIELVENFRATRKVLQEQHDSLQNLNNALEETNTSLRESEERYRGLVEFAPFAVFINRDDRIEYVNPAAIRMFGAASADELLGRSPYTLFHTDYHAIMTTRIEMLMKGHTAPLIEGEIIQLNGTRKHVEVAAVAFVDNKGVAIHVMLHDVTDRKEHENALRELLDRFSMAQKSSSAGFWDWDIQTDTLTWSPELFALFGLDPVYTEASFDVWKQVMHPGDWEGSHQRILAAIEKKERLCNEYRIVEPSGAIRWISAIGETVYDDAGKPLRMSGICIDVSDRKRMEQRLNFLADTAGMLLVTDSPQDAVEILCAKALSVLDCHAFFNFLVDDNLGRLHLNACAGITEEEKQKIEWLDLGVAVCGCAARDACRIVAEDVTNTPDERTVLVKSYGIKAYACHPMMQGEKVIGTISFGTRSRTRFSEDDLSVMKTVADLVAFAMVRKRAEESLSRAKREWERTFDSVPDLIAILDEHHRIVRVNRSMAQHLGREPKDCIGELCHNMIHGTTCPPSFCPHSRSLCDDKTHAVEVYEESLGGDFLVSTTPLHQADGKLIGTVHVARDISDRKRAEKALLQAHDQLDEKVQERTAQLADTISVLEDEVRERVKAQESLESEMQERLRIMEFMREQEKLMILQSRQAAMGEMIGNIAHQWRQPLNTLGLLLQKIEVFYQSGKFDADFLDKSVRKGMGIIQHMSQTIDDFRNFFRPEKEPKKFSIQETIRNSIVLIGDSFASHTIKIDVNNDCELETVGYPNEFSQALLNILLNAKDALLERNIAGPRISIVVEKSGDKGIIVIKDNAGGMAEEIMDKIFDPYFTTKGPQHGTGLGLYMAKMIIEKNMGGQLWARNGSDGAEFHIEVGQVSE